MNDIWDQSRLQNYIDDQIEENLALEYKASGALAKINEKKIEVTKDVSAFANSAGGILIYGIKEYNDHARKHLPEKIDPLDRRQISKEWLEQVISNIRPRIADVVIHPVPLNGDQTQVAYVVEIPRSITAHQATNHIYYRRYNFESVAMEDYEIQDVRNRRHSFSPLVKFDVEVSHGSVITLVVANIGNSIAQNVKFNFLTPLVWEENRGMPPLLKDGAQYLSPGEIHKFHYGSFFSTVNKEMPSNINVEISYNHPEIGQRISDIFRVDFKNYQNSLVTQSELYQLGKTIEKALGKLADKIQAVNKNLDTLSEIASLTGLQLSVPTLKNLKHILDHSTQFEKIDPTGQRPRFFMEVLGIDRTMASRLNAYYLNTEDKNLEDIEGISEEIIAKIKEMFI